MPLVALRRFRMETLSSPRDLRARTQSSASQSKYGRTEPRSSCWKVRLSCTCPIAWQIYTGGYRDNHSKKLWAYSTRQKNWDITGHPYYMASLGGKASYISASTARGMPRNASPGTVQTSWALLTYARISLFHVKRSNSRYGSFLRRSALITSSAGFTEAIPGNDAAGGKFRRVDNDKRACDHKTSQLVDGGRTERL